MWAPGDVFHELIGSGVVPVTVLDEIFRQAQDSLIAHNARFINEGKTTLYYGEDFAFHKAESQEETAGIIRELYREQIRRKRNRAGGDFIAVPLRGRGIGQQPE